VAEDLHSYQSALTYQTIYSPALERNLLGDAAHRHVTVFLPPSYFNEPERRYPALYLLHGYNGTSTSWTSGSYQGFNIQIAMEVLVREGRVREMIVVMPDARNGYGGSYYTNSPVTGNWEDFIARDLVAYVDSRYRTLPQAASRAVAGQSMGGYGAVYVGIKRTDVFSVVYGTSPCALDFVADLAEPDVWMTTLQIANRDDMGTLPQSGIRWKGNYPSALIGLAAAVSPNPAKPPLFVDLPFELAGGRPRRLEPVVRRWLEFCPAAMVERYRSALLRLRGLRFTVGAHDHLPHIPEGARSLARALTQHGVPHTFDDLDTDHASSVREWMETLVLPYSSEKLAFEMVAEDAVTMQQA
jgi:S-formylglutathione hydrolase